jgi:hypothetical protein
MLQHGVLRVEQFRGFEGVRDFEYKLFPGTIRYQKVLVALAR